MTTYATRMTQIHNREGSDVEFIDANDNPMITQNGASAYGFARKAKGNMTVDEWKHLRFNPRYNCLGCRVLYGDGRVAPGQTLLSTVRESYT